MLDKGPVSASVTVPRSELKILPDCAALMFTELCYMAEMCTSIKLASSTANTVLPECISPWKAERRYVGDLAESLSCGELPLEGLEC